MSGNLSPKALADFLNRSVDYVYAMRQQGFPMPGGTATGPDAKLWLSMHESTGRPFRVRPRRRINRMKG